MRSAFFQHFNARRRSLAERAHAEAQCVSFPDLLLHRDQAEVTVGAREALLEAANCFDLPEAMGDDGCDGIAHGIYNRVAWTCMHAIMIQRRSRQLGCVRHSHYREHYEIARRVHPPAHAVPAPPDATDRRCLGAGAP